MAVHVHTGFTGTAVPLDHPRIGWRRITGTVAASSAAAGYAAANGATVRTDSFWRPTALPATWAVDAGSAQAVGYCGIAAHDLGSRGATVIVESSPDGLTWTTRATHVPADDSAILILFARVSVRHWRVRITGAAVPTIGVIQFGDVTEFPQRAIYAPSVSFEHTRVSTYSVNETDGGQWGGRTLVRQSLAPRMAVSHLSEAWIAAEWVPFARHAEVAPFFVADRPGDFPASVAYAWTRGDLRAQRAVANAAIACSVELDLMGFMA